MNNESQIEVDEGMVDTLLRDILFLEKKNINTKELKDSEMIKEIKKSIEREASKNEV